MDRETLKKTQQGGNTMRKVCCEACGHQIELTSELLAKAASDIQTRFGCPNCTAVQEIAYASGCGLIHATTGTLAS